MVGIGGDVGGDAELGAGGHRGGEQREVLRVDEPPPMVAGLGPGIGVKQEDSPDRGRRQDLDEVARVAGMEADVPDPRLLDAAQGHRHPVHEGLAADQPDAGMGHGLRDEVLAPAEADLEPERTGPLEERREVERRAVRPGAPAAHPAARRHPQPRQQLVEEPSLRRLQLLAVAAAVEIAPRRRRALAARPVARGHARASEPVNE